MMSTPSHQELLHAYRHLYRGVLHAIQFAKPGRYIARNQLRNAFRKGDPACFDQAKVDRTLEFLKYAEKERGLEHKILKNLLQMEYWRSKQYLESRKDRGRPQIQIRRTSRHHYDMTLAMLNDSMGLCLR